MEQAQMTESEEKLLIALALMVKRYLHEYGDQVDTLAMSAGEHAVEALADFGLMESVNSRVGRWTPEGNKFIENYIHRPVSKPSGN
jgi:hypothetical protein